MGLGPLQLDGLFQIRMGSGTVLGKGVQNWRNGTQRFVDVIPLQPRLLVKALLAEIVRFPVRDDEGRVHLPVFCIAHSPGEIGGELILKALTVGRECRRRV